MTFFPSGAASAIRFTAEMPSIPGSRTSMITTSGRRRLTASITSSPVSTEPTSSRSGASPNMSPSPCRTVGWSSTARHRVFVDIIDNPNAWTRKGPSTYDAPVFASMVVGTDGSETASEAVRQAAELAKQVGARVHLVSAYEPVPEGRLREERQQVPGDLQWMVNPREDVSQTLEEAAGRLREAGLCVETHARAGDPADAILDVAEEEGAELIVVGNKGMTGAKRFLLGSVPNKVSHHAPCSVMIIRTT